MERGCALLGYVPIGNIGMLLLATRLRNAATLPGGHVMRLVTESRWLQLPLPVWLSHIPLDSFHFFASSKNREGEFFLAARAISAPKWPFSPS